MRRWLTAALLLLLAPACALAAPDTPYAPETVIHTTELSDEAAALLDVLYPAVLRCEEVIELPENTRYDDAMAATKSLSTDYPELFHLGSTWRIGYLQDSPELAQIVMPNYTMTLGQGFAMRMVLLKVAGEMTAGLSGTQADRAEALHDLLCLRASYVPDREINKTAFGAIVDGEAQCEGYSRGLMLLYRLAGIPCGMVSGETIDTDGNVESHSWNVAEIDSVAAFIDVTWDDQETCNTHWYDGLTDEMIAADHRMYPDYVAPACVSTEVNWHARRGLLITGEEMLDAALMTLAEQGEISLRFADRALYDDFIARPDDWINDFNARHPQDAAFWGVYAIYAGDTQPCVLLRREEQP